MESLLFLPVPDLTLERVQHESGTLVLTLRRLDAEACCPDCGYGAKRVQSRYRRTLADLPHQGVPVRLQVQVRRFRCEQPACQRAIFTERLPALAPPHARRTRRLSAALTRVGAALGGEAAARLLPTLGFKSSADTLLRLVHHAEVDPAPPPRVVGVDDWAIRRGHTYGTILVDLERRAPIDLLPDRTANTLACWLKERRGIALVARDRAETYAQGIHEGAPRAVQVADRWHLLKNLGEVLERLLQRHRGALERAATLASAPMSASASASAPPPHADGAAVVHELADDTGASSSPAAPPRAATSRTKRQRLYEQVHALHAQGFSINATSQRIGLSRQTVRKYLRADRCPERAKRRTKIGTWTEHDSFLRTRWNEGFRDAVMLFHELATRGFRGTLRTVQRHVASWRRGDDPRDRARRPSGGVAASKAMRPPSPRELRWWLLKDSVEARGDAAERTDAPTPDQRRYLHHLREHCPAIAAGQRLAQDFARVVRTRDAGALVPWLEQAAASSLAEFRDFAAGLRRDERAVKAALTEAWSNGQTEGQVTKLKMLKRQMYGRASVALLRQRLLLAA
ncbi:ISL3 family transposase [Sorangium sp. So ce590]|uniref:ISL3 family transposase n=1 Tax=Sorangium sp. So ce590 TaxID=3133317 RepID=UPI003F629CA3